MTKIKIDDGKSEVKKPASKSAAKKTTKKVAQKTAAKTVAKSKKSAKKTSIPVKKAPLRITVSSNSTHSTLQKSTTLSRRYVKRPVAKTETVKKSVIEVTKIEQPAKKAIEQPAEKAAKKPVAKKAITNDRAIKSALKDVATMNDPTEMKQTFRKKNRGRRVVLALVCSALSVGALVAFVHFNMPDISVRVAALQTGIEASYPTFVPRNYTLSNVTSDKEGEVVLYFDGPDGATFSLSEEGSTWDSTALLNNYVKKAFPADYATLREQGITIYVRGENAAWVNGGILYKIHTTGKTLTKEQIRNIATSL